MTLGAVAIVNDAAARDLVGIVPARRRVAVGLGLDPCGSSGSGLSARLFAGSQQSGQNKRRQTG
jgi:hypothetical protein